jgi:hypothetical protein
MSRRGMLSARTRRCRAAIRSRTTRSKRRCPGACPPRSPARRPSRPPRNCRNGRASRTVRPASSTLRAR